MARRSANRAFGFRSEGILRILLAADPAEILEAVEQLGFRLPDRAPITGLIDLISELHGTTEAVITEFFVDLTRRIVDAIDALVEHEVVADVDNKVARSLRDLRQLKARQLAFKIDLERRRVLIEITAEDVRNQIPEELQ